MKSTLSTIEFPLPGPPSPTDMFQILRFELEFKAEKPFWVSGYRGSAWRGVFGHALKQLVCIWRERDCPRCLVAKNCSYPYIFETPMVRSHGDREELSPHPFVLNVEGGWRRRQVDSERLGITLLGDGCASWPYVLQALREAGAMGVGSERIPMRMLSVRQELGPGSGVWKQISDDCSGLSVQPQGAAKIPPLKTMFRIRIMTPLRLRIQQKLVTPEELTTQVFLSALERRAAMLGRLHGNRMPGDNARLAARWAERVREVDRNLYWHDWERYSNRQQRKVPMGGVVGDWVWETGEDWGGWESVWWGQWLHAGKGTSMGLGKFRIEPL